MTDEDVVARVAGLLGKPYHRLDRKPGVWRPVYQVAVRGLPAVELMRLLRPHMGQRRQRQIDAAIASYRVRRNGKLTPEQAAEIRRRFRAGEQAIPLAAEFGVSKWTVWAIHAERVHKGM
jgi:hypothetical protein